MRSEQNKTNEWSTITSALRENENGEWHDATPVNESALKLEEQIKALQIKLEEAKKLYVNN